jgi:hypothetical protein
VTYAHWAAAILANGLGRYAAALAAARHASQDSPALYMAGWALPELIEAAARTANTRLARDALARLTETTQAGQTDFGLGLQARSRALANHGATAEGCYREAIGPLGRTQLRPELARAHLLYGEWPRRQLGMAVQVLVKRFLVGLQARVASQDLVDAVHSLSPPEKIVKNRKTLRAGTTTTPSFISTTSAPSADVSGVSLRLRI